MSRSANITLGIAMILLGVTLSLTSRGVIFYGLVLFGAFRIVRGVAGTDASPLNARPSLDDPRWQPSEERQIVGQPCARCSARFVTAGEAQECDRCDGLLHARDCFARHLVERHAPKQAEPYR